MDACSRRSTSVERASPHRRVDTPRGRFCAAHALLAGGMVRPRARLEPKWLRIVARRAGVTCARAPCAPTHRYKRYGLNVGNMHCLLCAVLVVCSMFVDKPIDGQILIGITVVWGCLLYTSPSPRDA
eukprot:7346575-Lingulodinium_polyedra.AAC.1